MPWKSSSWQGSAQPVWNGPPVFEVAGETRISSNEQIEKRIWNDSGRERGLKYFFRLELGPLPRESAQGRIRPSSTLSRVQNVTSVDVSTTSELCLDQQSDIENLQWLLNEFLGNSRKDNQLLNPSSGLRMAPDQPLARKED